MKKHNSNGFTFIELLIATTVLSTVIILSFAGYMNVSRLSYKGINISQTKQVTSLISGSIISDVRSASAVNSTTSGAYSYYCVGKHRYSYILYNRVDGSDSSTLAAKVAAGKTGLVLDTLPSSNVCQSFATYGPSSDAREILADNMRLLSFSITSLSASSYNVAIRVAFGLDAVLTSPIDANATCKTVSGGTQFCAISDVATVATKGY